MSEVYQFSIEDFHNRLDAAKKYVITQYAIDLLIIAASTINDGSKAEIIVNDAYQEVIKNAEQFHSQAAIKEFLYQRVNEDCEKYNQSAV
jgi:hypothetical protein